MNISGTITEAGQASPPSGQFNVRYQDIVITDPNSRKWYGRIGSKQGYQTGEQITVSVEQKADNDGNTYNYFKRFNPQYGGQPSPPPPQSGRQAPPLTGSGAAPAGTQRSNDPPPAPNGNEMRIVREVAIKAVLKRVEIPLDLVKDYLLTSVQFILTGNWKLEPRSHQNNSQPDTSGAEGDVPW